MNTEQANNKLPEKTIPEQIEEWLKPFFPDVPIEVCTGPIDHEHRNTLQRHKRNCLKKGVEFASSLYEAELSSKDKLIETTHNNLLAALEEVKRLKGLVKDNWMQYFGRQFIFASQRDKMWKQFCKENNIQP